MREQHTMSAEEWRAVVGYEGLYEVSNLGRLRCLTRDGQLLPGHSIHGYRYVHLRKQGHSKHTSIHRLVATAFIGPPPEGYECNHKDFVRDNNVVGNLEWVTHLGNIQHYWREG